MEEMYINEHKVREYGNRLHGVRIMERYRFLLIYAMKPTQPKSVAVLVLALGSQCADSDWWGYTLNGQTGTVHALGEAYKLSTAISSTCPCT